MNKKTEFGVKMLAILTSAICILLLVLALYTQLAIRSFNIVGFFVAFCSFISCFIFYLILNFLKKRERTKRVKAFVIVISVLLFLFMCAYSFFGSCLTILAAGFADLRYESKNEKRNVANIEKVFGYGEDNFPVSHFPRLLPSDIQNYYFLSESDFHGGGIHYLKFNTNKKYIQNEISKNEIVQTISYEKIDDYYRFLDSYFNIEQSEKKNYTTYILKQNPKSARYTSGIIASDDEIIFFCADFDIKK